jgi:hypothetical protein
MWWLSIRGCGGSVRGFGGSVLGDVVAQLVKGTVSLDRFESRQNWFQRCQ